MILKALYDYYQRCEGLAPSGMEYKEIAFLIVIDKDGNFIDIEDRRVDKKTCQKFLVAKGVGRTSGQVSNLLWDNSSYVLGLSDADVREVAITVKPESERTAKDLEDINKKIPKEKSKNIKCYQCFVDKVNEVYSLLPDNETIRAVQKFYAKSKEYVQTSVTNHPMWEVMQKNLTKNISIIINGEKSIVAENKEILSQYINRGDDNGAKVDRVCLITGEKGTPVETTTATSIPGSQATAKLVSFQVSSGYDSYGKTKGYNAPISKEAEFAYTTALNCLLGKDSKNKFFIGSRTYIFWASSKDSSSVEAEECLFALFGYDKEDNPNRGINEVKQVFNDIYSGKKPTKNDDYFYIMGLAPNAARIAVVYWSEQSVRDFAGHILRHFEDMEIVDSRKKEQQRPYAGLHSMMASVTQGGKSSDVQPNMPDAVIKSIMQETPYPESLFQSCIRRIRAEQSITVTRAAILKAYINRQYNQNKLNIMLDKENTNQGYLCGRLFATLEYIQERANNIHSIRERYMNAASATPSVVFATLLNLSTHHAEKLDRGGQIFFENLKGEIIEKISDKGFPAHLDLNDQGRFFVGYYHQRQSFYTKSNKEEE
jgi:CRISPR-associated protein Csd1